MPRAGVICEFNPFHNGHKFLLKKIKSSINADIICIMSGSFVQRGDIAITDKYTRTRAALENGADMVVELPTVYTVASARIFAENGARIAADLGCDTLCFGAEDDIDALHKAVDLIDSPDVQKKIAAYMNDGEYYPKALSLAIGEPFDEIVRKPNNILALEYIRACRAYGITPLAFPREGVDHDASDATGNIASASLIRDLICSGQPYGSYSPMEIDHPASLSDIEPVILFKLKTMDKDEIALLPDVTEGLENRIYDTAVRYHSLEEIYEQIKTKRYTMARIRRIIISALLDITKRLQNTPVPYIRVLGVKKDKAHLIGAKDLPLIIDVKRGYDSLNYSSKEIFNIDIKASKAMDIALKETLNEFSQGVIKR